MKNIKSNINKNSIVSLIFILTIFTLLFGFLTKIGEGVLTRIEKRLSPSQNITSEATQPTPETVDLNKLYPVKQTENKTSDTVNNTATTVNNNANLTIGLKTPAILKKIIDRGEALSTDSVMFKTKFIELNGLFNRVLGKRLVNDVDKDYNVGKLDNGYLVFTNPKIDITKYAQQTKDFKDYLAKQNIPLLYIQAPYKISKYDPELPTGFENYTNENDDNMLAALSKANVNTLDFREEIAKDNLNHYDMFFKTDHHWTPKAGFWAATKVAHLLRDNYNFKINEEDYNLDNYNINTLNHWFLGSQGKRVGVTYTGDDDIDLITPKFETDFNFSVPTSNINRSGEFKDTMFLYDLINKKDYYNLSPYESYIGGNYDLNLITNNKSPNNKRILLVRDSFACAMTPFLAMSCKNLDTIDLRYYTASIKSYIEQNRPDVVILMYSNQQDEYFNFK
ncbi:DHHW family protein [Clostridium saccharoperbutylacetonicum]|uniref:DHHW family protein n=1 Tax=Clostridium saccharoperbutylacetonicum TaxID=36745 RepID=UPI0039EA85A4